MNYKTPAELCGEIASKGPSSAWGDSAAVVCSLAAMLAGIEGRAKVDTITFGSSPAKPCDEPSVAEKLMQLAEQDTAAESAVRDVLRQPAMILSQRESRRAALNESYTAAARASLKLLDACGEVGDRIRALDDSRSNILSAQRAAALALCVGAMRSLKAEALLRISSITDTVAAEALQSEVEAMCQRYIPAAESACEAALSSLESASSGNKSRPSSTLCDNGGTDR